MRPGQNNKRIRGRNNNNRKGPNPLSRSYESNGPDVKVRGTAAHIAEKYVQLARDAHSSGDPVAAESYLQHAEHYYRLLMAAQQAQQPQQSFQNQQPGAPQAPRQAEAEADEGYDADDEFDSGVMDRFTFRAPQQFQPPGNGPQPVLGEGEAADGDQPPVDQPREYRPDHRSDTRGEHRNEGRGEHRQERHDSRQEGRGERGFDNRGPRPNRDQRFDNRGPRRERPPFGEGRQPDFRQPDFRQPEARQPDVRPPRPQFQPQPEIEGGSLPAFITGGRPAPAPEPAPHREPPAEAPAAEEVKFPVKTRRRRTKSEEPAPVDSNDTAAE